MNSITDSSKWKLIWSDEFDCDGKPDPSKWDYEEGFIRNNEMQYYTRDRRNNARVENGNLVIEGLREPFKNSQYNPSANDWRFSREYAEYTSACLITQHRMEFLHGRIEVRAQLPQGPGVWPAIWMLGANIDEVDWPRCGEIDIMEFVGHDPEYVHGTAHYFDQGKQAHDSQTAKLSVEKPWEDFHVYAIEWTAEKIVFSFDSYIYHTFSVEQARSEAGNPFHRPHYLLINLALGGTWGKEIDDSMLPQKFLIDYVRVYSK